MFEADITKVVEEMSVRIRETEEDFILDTIFPYCQETLQKKINKAELKQIILRGSRPKGKWIKCKSRFGTEYFKCSECGKKLNWIDSDDNYCNSCGSDNSESTKELYKEKLAEMNGGSEDADSN